MARSTNKNENNQQRLEDISEAINEAVAPEAEPDKEEQPPVNQENNDKKEETTEKKSLKRRIGESLIASDDKKMQKKEAKERKAAEKQAAKANAPKKTWKDYAKTALKVTGIVALTAAGTAVALSANNNDSGADYVDDGSSTTYLPEQTVPVETPKDAEESADNSPITQSVETGVEESD